MRVFLFAFLITMYKSDLLRHEIFFPSYSPFVVLYFITPFNIINVKDLRIMYVRTKLSLSLNIYIFPLFYAALLFNYMSFTFGKIKFRISHPHLCCRFNGRTYFSSLHRKIEGD